MTAIYGTHLRRCAEGSTVQSEARYKSRSEAWETRGRWQRALPTRARRGLQRRLPMAEGRRAYLWFEEARVVARDMRLMCVVAGRGGPRPGVLLHPDCPPAAPRRGRGPRRPPAWGGGRGR